MKQVTNEISELSISPRTVAVELFVVYGMVRLGMDLWSWIV